jgi:pyruvate dehydrogenase E1 component
MIAGMYRFRAADELETPATGRDGSPASRAQLLASGVAMRWALAAQEILAATFGVAADVWSVTSWNELRRDALASERANLLGPEQPESVPYVTRMLAGQPGPVVAVSDWMQAVPDQIARWVPQPYTSLGTDGFGRSDTRAALRRHFHVDAESVVVATLESLVRSGEVKASLVEEAIARFGLRDGAPASTPAGEADERPISG